MIRLVGFYGCAKTGCTAMFKGMPKHGDEFIKVQTIKEAEKLNPDGFIQTNLMKPKFIGSKGKFFQYVLDSGKPFLVAESASFRQYPGWTRLGWYSYKWTDGIFGNENSPPDRWNKFQKATGIRFKDWHSPGDAIVIMGQKEGDSSLEELYKKYKSFYGWMEDTIIEIRKHTDRPIIIRPHPRNRKKGDIVGARYAEAYDNVSLDENESVLDTLHSAYCAVTYNSLSAVESVTEGIPTFALNDGSMVWPVAHKDLSQIENLDYSIDLTQWKYDIAYTQWNKAERKSGEAWAHVKPLMFP